MTADARRRRARPQLGRASWQRVRRAVLARDRWECAYCGAPATMVDHRTPPDRYDGPHDDPDNLVACCVSCNNSKRDLTVEEWHARRGLSKRSDGRTGYPFAYHRHRVSADVDLLVGDMGIPWAGTGCPPGCSVPALGGTR